MNARRSPECAQVPVKAQSAVADLLVTSNATNICFVVLLVGVSSASEPAILQRSDVSTITLFESGLGHRLSANGPALPEFECHLHGKTSHCKFP